MRSFVVNTVITAVAFYVLTKFLSQFVAYDGELIGLLAPGGHLRRRQRADRPGGPDPGVPAQPHDHGADRLRRSMPALLLVTAYVANSTGFDLTVGDFPPDITVDTIVAAVIGSVVLSVVGAAARLVVPD